MIKNYLIKKHRGFPGDPAVKRSYSDCMGCGLAPWSGT